MHGTPSWQGVTLLIPVLNERIGLEQVLPRIAPGCCDQVLIVDGGSTDGSVEWCLANGYEVYVQKRSGIRFAYLESLPLVRGEILVTFSPDGNCLPEAIPALVERIRQGDDLVIASRYLDGATSDDDDWLTAFGNWLFTRTVNLLHGGRYTDAMGIFRAFRRQLIHDLGLDREDAYRLPERLFGTTISWEPLMSVRAARRGRSVSEIPADEPARIGGERKLQVFRWGAAYYFQFWWEWLLGGPRRDRQRTAPGNPTVEQMPAEQVAPVR